MIEEAIGDLLSEKKLKLTVAESCTGGLISYRITSVPGSSDYFLGAYVTYSNELKKKIIGVKDTTLERYGAVSSECALEMAEGAKAVSEADVSIGVTGIAGPGGATPVKPVGLVYIAIVTEDQRIVKTYHFTGDRKSNREMTAETALKMLYEILSGMK